MGWAAYGAISLVAGLVSHLGGGPPEGSGDVADASLERVKLLIVWAFLFSLLGALAMYTNPSDSSFRSYLTELSFRRHLRELHRPSPPAAEADLEDHTPSVGHLKAGSTPNANGPANLQGLHWSKIRAAKEAMNTDGAVSLPASSMAASSAVVGATAAGTRNGLTAEGLSIPPHKLPPFRFANRVSISLRTPVYTRRDLGLFTIVTIAPNPGSTLKTGRDHNGKIVKWIEPETAESLLAGVWFVGMFGRWWMAGLVRPTPTPAGQEESPRAGVLGMRSLDGTEDPLAAAVRKAVSETDNSALKPTKVQTPPRPARSRRPSFEAPVVPDKPPQVPPEHMISPSATPPSSEQDRPSPTPVNNSNHLSPSPTDHVSLPPIDRALLTSNPALSEVHTALLASHATTADLRAQLEQVSAASEASHSQLEASLESLRARKREEDTDRLEVKSRTKALEDGKRQAEAAKREADKKLRLTEGLRDAVLARIEVLSREVEQAKERMKTQRSEIEESKRSVKEREGEVKEKMEQKRDQVAVVEEGVAALASEAKELELRVREEEAALEESKKAALAVLEAEARKPVHQPTSFAPFGSPVPRSVENDFYGLHQQQTQNQQQQPREPVVASAASFTTASSTSAASTASNPSSSLFDLPIQQLPLSLLQRRRFIDSSAADTSPSTSSLLSQSATPSPASSFQQVSDVFGFEDFGPGSGQPRRFSAAQHGPAFPVAYARGEQPPLIFTGEEGSEPGSPGPMSASFSEYLPRGLFQSISAEGLLSPDADGPASPFTAAYTRSRLEVDHDSRTEAPGSRRMSLGDADVFFPADEDLHEERHDQVFDLPARPPSDSVLPSSPRSVFSDDPRSLLLDPSLDENFSFPPPGIDTIAANAFSHSSNFTDFDQRPSPTTSTTRTAIEHQHLAQTHDETYQSQRFAVPNGIRRIEGTSEGYGDDHSSPEQERASLDKPSKFTPKRWFSSSKTPTPSEGSLAAVSPTPSSAQTVTLRNEPKLNPDAKAFSFKGFPSLRLSSEQPAPSSAAGVVHGRAGSDLSVSSAPFVPSVPPRSSSDNLLLPPGAANGSPLISAASSGNGSTPSFATPSSSNASRFFSSLRAFAPSAAEREALTRALRQNGSNRSLENYSGDGNPSSPPLAHAPAVGTGTHPYGYSAAPGRGGMTRSSPYATPDTSATDLNARAAAAWDNERPPLDAGMATIRRKSFRFFNLGSTFRKGDDTDDPLLQPLEPPSQQQQQPGPHQQQQQHHLFHHDLHQPPSIHADWAPAWGKRDRWGGSSIGGTSTTGPNVNRNTPSPSMRDAGRGMR